MVKKMTIFATLAVMLLASPMHGERPTSDELSTSQRWVREVLLTDKPFCPFSFSCDGQSWNARLGEWTFHRQTRSLDGQRREHALTWTERGERFQLDRTVIDGGGCHESGTAD